MTKEELLEHEVRAAGCAEATIPGDQLRELIRLALIGFDEENKE
jgi:hypothetical protein